MSAGRDRDSGFHLLAVKTHTPSPSRRASRYGRRSSSIGGRSLLSRRSSVGFPLSHCQDPARLVAEMNAQVAQFRDLLLGVGQARDSPELRERIRKVRRICVDGCKHTSGILLPQMRSLMAEGIPGDNPHFVLLFFIAQLFLRELAKCRRLVVSVPMDMTGFYDNRQGPSNLGSVLSQILLCKSITPDFHEEEVHSIAKDSQDVLRILRDMQEFMPLPQPRAELREALVDAPWWGRRRDSACKDALHSLCCITRPAFL